MSKYKVGDKFIIEICSLYEDDTTDILYQIDGFKSLVFDDYGLDKLQKINPKLKIEDIDDMLAEHDLKKEAYEKGLNDAWELARKICGYGEDTIDGSTLGNIFELGSTGHIMTNNTYQEALAKIEAYEKSQQIEIGDVVYSSVVDSKEGICVGRGNDGEEYALVWFKEYNCPQHMSLKDLKKTGWQIDISKLLEKIRGDE